MMAHAAYSHASETIAAEAEAAIRPGFSLPAYFYTSDECFAHDMRVMKEEAWLLAAHASQIPKAGDYVLFELDNESIIVIRARDGSINAFYNVCRHRGSRICLTPAGNARLLVCPYHAWSYDPTGRLIASPDMPDWFDKAQYALKRCNIGVFEGLIFINLAQRQAPDFTAFTARFVPFAAQYDVANTKVVAQDILPCPANWKLVMENFAECYHCNCSHKEYVSTHRQDSMLEYSGDTGGDGDWVGRMTAQGLYLDPIFDPPQSVHMQGAMRVQIGGTSVSGGKTGGPLAPKLGQVGEWSGGWMAMMFSPLCQVAVYDDHVIMFSFVPRAAGSTDCVLTWLVRADAVEGVDYDANEVAFMWRHTIGEDKTICANNQLGVESAAYQPGPYSKVESRAAETVDWYVHNFLKAVPR